MILADKIQQRLVTTLAGISIRFGGQDKLDIACVLLKRNKGKLIQVNAVASLTSPDALTGHLPKGTPVWIALSGKGVLTRKLGKEKTGNIINALLPNARAEDFFATTEYNAGNECFGSAVRSSQLNRITDQLTELGYPVFGCSLSCMALDSLVGAKLLQDREILLPDFRVTVENETISGFEPLSTEKAESYYIGSDRLENRLLLPFALAFNFLAGINTTSAEPAFLKTQESFCYGLVNRYFSFGALGAIFILLMLNFLLFSKANTRVSELTNTVAVHSGYFSERDSLQKEIFLKTKLVEENGLSGQSLFGFYADRIAATLSGGITLEELTLNPPDGKIRNGKPIHFTRKIRIRGASQGTLILNQWIREMEKLEWITHVEVIVFEHRDGAGKFELELNY